MASFELFSKLPANIRHDIWRHVTSAPRVVGIFETHEMDYASVKKTEISSFTRPLALLNAYREARKIGLTVYKRAEIELLHGGATIQELTPTYFNPERDIIYRGKTSCGNGDMFRIRCRDWHKDTEPMALASTLALDSRAITRWSRPAPEMIEYVCMRFQQKEQEEALKSSIWASTMKQEMKSSNAAKRDCARSFLSSETMMICPKPALHHWNQTCHNGHLVSTRQ